MTRLQREQQLTVSPTERAALLAALKLIEEDMEDGRQGDERGGQGKTRVRQIQLSIREATGLNLPIPSLLPLLQLQGHCEQELPIP